RVNRSPASSLHGHGTSTVLTASLHLSRPRVASLFSGVGGFEKAFEEAGWTTSIQCELDPAARFVLGNHFDSPVHDDITTLESLPEVECVTAGFPCTNLSQAGNK